MSVRSFFDSNILVYTDDDDAPDKKGRALELYAECRSAGTGVVSTQVLQEYFVVTTRRLGVDAALARRKTELFGRLQLVPIRLEDIVAAIDLHRIHALSFWDALIVRAASASGCRQLYSEGMQTGWRLDGLEIVNPFA
jgi:predicted nucleic acid-binding protein